MTLLGILCALLTLAAGGLGIALLALPSRDDTNAVELGALTIILGGTLISALLFAFGYFVHGRALVTFVSICALGVGLAGFSRFHRTGGNIVCPRPRHPVAWFLCFLLLAQFCLAALQTLNHPMRWDGLMNWEFKARLAFLGHGAVPLSYYSDPSRQWSHPGYPLCIPLVQSWFYDWIGRADLNVAKLPFVVLYLAGTLMLFAGAKKISGESWRGAVAAALMFFVPALLVEPGSTTSAWADGPLALIYLAAVIYLLEYTIRGSRRALWLCGTCAAILPWVKQEGSILWACLLLIAICVAGARRETGVAIAAAIPGIIVIAGWKCFVTLAGVQPATEFLPFNMQTFSDHADRLAYIARYLVWQTVNVRMWSVLWIAAVVALCQLIARTPKKPLPYILALCILLPSLILSCAYLFSAWPDFRFHIISSLPRLLIDVAPVALLSIALGLPRLKTPAARTGE